MPLYDFECPEGHRFERSARISECDLPIPCEGDSCALMASTVITHSNPSGSLDHGLSSNRDAAREGRYDPLNPSRRFMAKGRGYRK